MSCCYPEPGSPQSEVEGEPHVADARDEGDPADPVPNNLLANFESGAGYDEDGAYGPSTSAEAEDNQALFNT